MPDVQRCPVCDARMTSGDIEIRAPHWRVVGADVLEIIENLAGDVERLGREALAANKLACAVNDFLAGHVTAHGLIGPLLDYTEAARDA
jgi:hypothetical protein